MSFIFKAVNLCIVTTNDKSWTRAKEACKALEYDAKTSKTANIIRARCRLENLTQKNKICSVHATYTPTNWFADSQKCDIHINEES